MPAPDICQPQVSVAPVLMPDRQAIERVLERTPLRHVLVHQRDEAGVVGGFEDVNQFVNDEVFEAFEGLFREVGVEAYRPCVVIAAPPLGFHALDEDSLHLHAEACFPFGDQRHGGQPQLLAIPLVHDGLALGLASVRADVEEHFAVFEFDGGGLVDLNDLEQVAFAPDVVAFTVEEFTGGFAFLLLEFVLLFANPGQFGDGKDADGIEAHVRRGRDGHASRGRVDAEVDIFDVLAHDGHQHVAELDSFIKAVAGLVKPGGLVILSTLNRTPKSFALGIVAAEYLLNWAPRGTHQWRKFVRPSELVQRLDANGLCASDLTGVVYSPARGAFELCKDDVSVNYMMTATPS